MASKGKKRKEPRLLESEDGDEETGLVNPMVEGDGDHPTGGGESSAAETEEEKLEGDALVKTMKKKRRQKKKELGDELISPKDDIGRELKQEKDKAREKIFAESQRLEPEVGDDGVVPMGPEEEEEPVTTFREPEEEETTEESEVKKLRRRQRSAEQEGRASPVQELVPEPEVSAEAQPEPPAKEPPPLESSLEESMGKTPRGSSLREKLRSRRQKAEAEVVEEVRQEAREGRERQLKGLKEKHAPSRFDLDPEELERQTEEKQREYRLKWAKKKQDKEKPGVWMPTPDEQYEFFTRNFDPEPEEPKEEPVEEKAETEKKEGEEPTPGPSEEPTPGPSEEPTPGPSEEPKEEGAEETEGDIKDDDKAPLMPGDDDDDEGVGPIVLRKAYFPDPDELQKKLDEILFYPSTATVPTTEKVFDQAEPRFLEEEGFYVGTKPEISTRNRNKMEHRLLKQPDDVGRKWFGEDGRMLALPDPLRSSPWRPIIPDEPDPELETVYQKAVMHDFDNRYIDGTVAGDGHYQLDIDINCIAFTHHHLFSREHVLATRLAQLYDQYLIRKKRNMAEYLTEKLRALKSSYLHLQEHISTHRSDHSQADRANYARRLADYKSEIRQTREGRDTQEKTDRTLLKNMIHTWKEIKAQRELQKYYNTAVKLQVTKEEVDKTQDTFLWKTEIEDEVDEAREEHEEENRKKDAQFQEELAKWQEQHEAKKAARKQQKKRRGSKQSSTSQQEPEPDTQSQTQSQKDEEPEEDMPRMEPLEPFDENTARERLTTKAKEIRRRPGEPKLHLELTNTMSISATHQCPRGEQLRREDISKVKLFVKVLFNNKEVSRTNAKPLSQEFKVTFGQIFNLKIASWPEIIKFQLFEVIGMSSRPLTELYLAVPAMSITTQSVRLEDMEFSSDHKVNHTHEGVGSGFPFTFGSKSDETLILMTTGTLSSSAAWALDENGQPLVPPSSTTAMTNIFNAMKKLDPLADIGAAGIMDIKALSKWFTESRLDPNDPKNAELVFMLKPKGTDFGMLEPADYFRLEQLQEEFDFATDEEMSSNKRYKLLEYRDREVDEFKNYKMVPLYEREIARDAFSEYEKKQREQERIPDTDDIESYRFAVNHFLQKMRENVLQKFRHLYHQKKFNDMILEEDVPNIAIIGTNIVKVFARRQPLKPKRKKKKTVSPQVVKPGEVHVLVNVSRVTHVPLRSASSAQGAMTTRGGEADRKGGKALLDVTVRPFVEVVFQHNVVKTSVGDGPNPSFNEELRIPFRAPNDDYKPSSLQTVKDNIFINLFDEVVVDIQEDDRQRETSVHQRIEKKWLGGLTIPFSTVYFNGKIDGTFGLNVPPILLGYAREEDESEVAASKDNNTYLAMFVTIEPKLPAAESLKERSFTMEDQDLLDKCDQWQAELAKKFPERDYKTTVIDMNGRAIFITRYIKPLKPPEALAQNAELVARYVAMIPFVSDSVLMPGLCDLWSTCDEFLKMLAGDEEEHAVLLLNYFLSMGKEAWLIIGTAIPEGPTAYVLTKDDSNFLIWNPSSGKNYNSKDSFCPLQSVSCIVNTENVWANIQQLDMPSQMTFDISMVSCWTPFFSRSYPSPGLGSVQIEALTYIPTVESEVTVLQDRIEANLKTKIQNWRKHHLTRWHRQFTKIMRKMLPLLEENLGKPLDNQKIEELEQAFKSYKVSGFPINMPFTEMTSIEETVFSKGVHAFESSDIEFALAVYIHPYPHRVLSVWIYVASLIRLN